MKHFIKEEFNCKCCGENKMSDDFLQVIEDVREIANVPFKVTSGYRCKKHNKAVGGKEDSAHTLGLAVDIATGSSYVRHQIIKALVSVGVTRFGIAKDFIHFDIDKSKPTNVVWVY